MNECRCRVDDRLIHSEVLYGDLEVWAPDQLVLASRHAASRGPDAALLPDRLAFAATAPEGLPEVVLGDRRVLVVIGTLPELTDAVAAGFQPSFIALANRARRPDTIALSPTFHADLAEWAALERLLDDGYDVAVQRLAAEPAHRIDVERRAAWRDVAHRLASQSSQAP